MSASQSQATVENTTNKKIEEVVRNVQPHWVGDGFPVRSLFSYQDGATYDPFLLLDYAEPYEFAPATAVRGVGEHPHRGFETVTIVYQGELEHRDSGGNHGKIGPGDVQWMTAASGVVHEEFHSERFSREGGTFEVAQLWVNLPAKDKMTAPRYQGIVASQIPMVQLPGGAGSVRVIAGNFQAARGPAKTYSPVTVLDLQLASGGAVELPIEDGFTTLLVVQRGAISVNGADVIRAGELARFGRSGSKVSLAAQADSRALVLAGQPLGEPIVGQGPFVMNSVEQIHQAISDYRAGRMGHLD